MSQIENMWAIMKDKIWRDIANIKDIYDLMEKIEDIFWQDQTILNCIQHGYDSMPYRI